MEVWPPSHFILVLRFRFSAHRDVAAYPTIRGLTQCGIWKVLAPSFFADGKSLDES